MKRKEMRPARALGDGADPETGTVSFEFRNSHYDMVFDMKAIAFFECEAEMSIVEAMEDMDAAEKAGRPQKASLIGFLMQAGLRRHHPEVTAERALAMTTEPEVMAQLGVAVEAASPDPRKAPPAATKKTKRSTSKRSSSPRSKRG